MSSQSMRVSLVLQRLATEINATLRHAAGEEIAFVVIVQADQIAQYVSNTKREDGVAALEGWTRRHPGPLQPGPGDLLMDLRVPCLLCYWRACRVLAAVDVAAAIGALVWVMR